MKRKQSDFERGLLAAWTVMERDCLWCLSEFGRTPKKCRFSRCPAIRRVRK
jgi:hypothetical protein